MPQIIFFFFPFGRDAEKKRSRNARGTGGKGGGWGGGSEVAGRLADADDVV